MHQRVYLDTSTSYLMAVNLFFFCLLSNKIEFAFICCSALGDCSVKDQSHRPTSSTDYSWMEFFHGTNHFLCRGGEHVRLFAKSRTYLHEPNPLFPIQLCTTYVFLFVCLFGIRLN